MGYGTSLYNIIANKQCMVYNMPDGPVRLAHTDMRTAYWTALSGTSMVMCMVVGYNYMLNGFVRLMVIDMQDSSVRHMV